MSKQMVNAFTCDAHGCFERNPTYTIQAIPDGWVSFEFQERRLYVCPMHARPLIDIYGARE